jgi:hypothetical protein
MEQDVLFFRHTDERFFYAHLLNTSRQVVEAERWLREALRAGTVDAETACLTRWNDETRRIEVVLGKRVYLLAGKVKTMSGLPGDVAYPELSSRYQRTLQ